MDQDDSAGADPQQTIRDLEQQAEKDKEALDKLLVAYQAQEADIGEMKAQVEALNRELIDKETEKEGINNLLSNHLLEEFLRRLSLLVLLGGRCFAFASWQPWTLLAKQLFAGVGIGNHIP